MTALSIGGPRPTPVGERLSQRRRAARTTTSTDRGVFDILKRRRQTEQDPPDLRSAIDALDALRGHTTDLDELRDAAMEVAVAAAHIVCRLPPRDLNLDDE